jgi:hypothetical protein
MPFITRMTRMREPASMPEAARPGGRERRAVRLGVAGAVLAVLVVGLLQALTVPPFQWTDEPSHYAYADEVSRGRLPTIETPVRTGGSATLERIMARRDPTRRTIWTANHPPLFYLVEAGPVRAAAAAGGPDAGLIAGRVVSVLLAAAGIALVGLLARLLVPARPAVAVVAAALAGLLPSFASISARLFNDSLAFLTATALLAVAVAWIVKGPSPARLGLLAATAAAAGATRASGLLAVGVAGLAVVAGSWLRARERGTPRPWLAGVGPGLVVAVAVAATSGWFWLRNLRLYGDLTGSAALLERFERAPRGSAPGILRDPGFWVVQQRRLWDPTYDLTALAPSHTRSLWLLGLVPLAGLLTAGIVVLRRRRAAVAEPANGPFPYRNGANGLRSGPASGRNRLTVAWLLGILLLGLMQVSVAMFAADGGGAHARYLFPALGVLAVAAAAGLAALPLGRRGLPALALVVAMIAANAWTWARGLSVMRRPPSADVLGTAFQASGLPSPAVVLTIAGVLLAAALAAQAVALWRLGAPARLPAPVAPAPPERTREPVG